MNSKIAALTLGVIVAGLGVFGLVSGEGRLADSMNINVALDWARIFLGGILIIGGLAGIYSARIALVFFGVSYLGMFIAGLASQNLFGMAPDGLGWLDQTLHLGGGLLGLAIPFLAEPARRGRYAM